MKNSNLFMCTILLLSVLFISCGDNDEENNTNNSNGCTLSTECDDGKKCVDESCVDDLCYQKSCEPDENCDGATGECIKLCATVTCDEGKGCDPDTGDCIELCKDIECAPESYCDIETGDCVSYCRGVSCENGQKCDTLSGNCVDNCSDIECENGYYCDSATGLCEMTCGEVECDEGLVCDPSTGDCVKQCDLITCNEGEICVEETGDCILTCNGEICEDGKVCTDNATGKCVDECLAEDGILEYSGITECEEKTACPEGVEELAELRICLDANRCAVRTQESPLGNLTADASLWYLEQQEIEVDLVASNGGGIRFSSNYTGETGVYSKGKLCADFPAELHPFGNTIVVVKMTGVQIKEFFENSIRNWPVDNPDTFTYPGRFMHISGGVVSYDMREPQQALSEDNTAIVEPGNRVYSVVIGDTEVDLTNDTDTYLIATSNYEVDGGDQYLIFSSIDAADKNDTTIDFKDALAQYLIDQVTIQPEVDGRLKFLCVDENFDYNMCAE